MIDLTIKTLDGVNRDFSVPETLTVKEFKEKIAAKINIPADVQRLIFHGRVLQDEKPLKDYDVQGKVIHVVQRAPPSSTSSATSSTTSPPTGPRPGNHDVNSFVLGSFTLPTDILDPQQIQNAVQQTLSGMGNSFRNARVSTRASNDGSSLDVHINLGQIPGPDQESDLSQRLANVEYMLELAGQALQQLENPLSTELPGGSASTPQTSQAPTSTQNVPGVLGATTASQSIQTRADTRPTPAATSVDAEMSDASRDSQAGTEAPAALARSMLVSFTNLASQFNDASHRLQPFLQQVITMMREDPDLPAVEARASQRLYNQVTNALHAISHASHGLSDLILDMTTPPPRQLIAPVQAPGVRHFVQHSIPVQTIVATNAMPAPSQAATSGSATSTPAPTALPTPLPTTAPTPMPPHISFLPQITVSSSVSAHLVTVPPASATTQVPSVNVTAPTASPVASTAASSASATPIPATLPLGGALPPGLPIGISNVLSSILTAHGHRPGQPVHVNIVPVSMSGALGPLPPGFIPPGFPFPPPPLPRESTSASTPASTTTHTTTSRPIPTPQTTTSDASMPALDSSTQSASLTNQPTGPGIRLGQPVDPYLPCQSHHFLSHRPRIVGRQPGLTPEASMAEMVTNLMTSLLQPHPPPSSTATTQTTATQPAPPPPGATQAAPQGGTGPAPGLQPTFADLLAGLFPGGAPIPPLMQEFHQTVQAQPSSMTPPNSATPTTDSINQMSEAQLAQLVHAVSQNILAAPQGRSPETIIDILRTLNASNIEPTGEYFLNDLVLTMAAHLTFPDLMQILSGQAQPLTHVRAPVRQFIMEHLLQDQADTPAARIAGMESLVAEIVEDFRQAEMLAVIHPLEGIDFTASLTRFLKDQLMKFTDLFLRTEVSDTEWATQVYQHTQRMLGLFVELCKACQSGGQPGVTRLLETRLCLLMRNVSQVMATWLSRVTVQQLQDFAASLSLSPSDVESYVVRNSAPAVNVNACRSESPMDTTPSLTAASSDRSSQTPIVNSIVQPPAVNTSETARCPNAVPHQSTEEGRPSPTPGVTPNSDESWQAAIPAEWVPIIKEDIKRQKQQRVQPPHSDAYLQGMPPKRRKIVISDRPSEICNMAEYLPESIRQAAALVGAEPITSMNNLASDAAQDTDLLDALDDEATHIIAQRLSADSDFSAKRFPRAQEYYHKTGK